MFQTSNILKATLQLLKNAFLEHEKTAATNGNQEWLLHHQEGGLRGTLGQIRSNWEDS